MEVNGAMNVAGKVLGRANFVIGFAQADIGIMDDDISDSDILYLVGVAVRGVGLLATGWVAGEIGVVSLGIAIYSTANSPVCD